MRSVGWRQSMRTALLQAYYLNNMQLQSWRILSRSCLKRRGLRGPPTRST